MTNSITDSSVLVIGGAGFIGSHLVEQLIEERPREIVVFDNFVRGKKENLARALAQQEVPIRIVEASITDLQTLREVVDGMDYIFHLAALWLGECVERPREALNVNVVGTFNIIEAARDAGVKKIVFSSSASVYGDAVTVPMTEGHPFNNRTMYGATKIAGEQFLRAFHDMYGLDYVGLRYMNVYGPRMDDKGVYVSVIVKVLDRIRRGLPPVIYGDGSQTYDFVFVEDVARANILALKSEVTDEFFNVGTGIPSSINELVRMLLELTSSALEPEYRPQERVFVTHRVGSTEKAERLLGFRARVPLREGLKRTIDWWKAQHLA